MDHEEVPERYLQRYDGTWSLVGPDGWEITPEELTEFRADVTSPIAALALPAIDVEPISVRDGEVR
ncbi:hypothetical protein [Nocardia sp. CNY236]|uniref:hypothetical protein n=1 Tax=Nocardia sp. CNY236 TaxID=1169152 RepID=UPI000411BA38|nr:hypothetical protein [Nocardia sp. CNY236]